MTARWWTLAASCLVCLAAGLWLEWATLVALGGSGVVLLAVPATLQLVRRASWRDLSAPTRVTRGEEAAILLEVDLPSGSPRWMSAVGSDARVRVPIALQRGRVELRWPLDTSRRGPQLGGPARLESADPFGLVCRVLATRTPTRVLVVPRVHPVTRTGARRRDDGEEAEERARGEAFHSLREYVPGDPPKLIHWRASARSGTLIVRRTVDTTVPWLLVILDVNERAYDRPGALFADFDSAAFEDAVDDAASWSWHGCGPEQRVLLTTTAASGMALDPVEVSARTRDRALDALALVEPVAPEACGPGVPQALLRSQGVARAVFVTGHRRETSRAWLASWRRTSIVMVIGAPG